MEAKAVGPGYTARVKRMVLERGASLVGIADAGPLRALRLDPPDLLDRYPKAISIALQLPRAVFEDISDRPTPLYRAVCGTANLMLDEIAYRTAVALQEDGFLSLPIPASQILDRKGFYGALSHKAVARMAGLGWQGKNLLLITPEYGSRVRLATVLTEAPLDSDGPVENRCGPCSLCKEACPAGAVKGVATEGHYESREEALHFSRCVEKVVQGFAKEPNIGAPVCGVCIRACPFS